MKDESKETIKLVNQWIDIAEEDFNLAKIGLSISSGVSYRIIAFHSQQCAEKYLKAFLVFHDVNFPYTHNITTLIDLCSKIDNSFEKLRKAEILTSYATANRYPGEFRKLRKQDALNSVKLAEIIRSKLRDTLTKTGLKLKKS
jgi:HEPN domain-containing protein